MKKIFAVLALVLIETVLSACREPTPSPTPFPATFTPFATATPTNTSTPTVTPTATSTPTATATLVKVTVKIYKNTEVALRSLKTNDTRVIRNHGIITDVFGFSDFYASVDGFQRNLNGTQSSGCVEKGCEFSFVVLKSLGWKLTTDDGESVQLVYTAAEWNIVSTTEIPPLK